MSENIELKKMQWHSRRGMLELDLLLVPFASEKLARLDAVNVERYRKLLEQEDQDLFRWFIEKEVVPDPDLRGMVAMILGKELPADQSSE